VATFSNKPWGQFSESDYEDADDYCSAALIDENTGSGPKVKSKCHLPVKEPHHGPYNRNGIHAAAVRIGQTQAPAAAKRAAAAKLRSLYRQMGEKPPPSIAN
jgi:hypothetical protein